MSSSQDARHGDPVSLDVAAAAAFLQLQAGCLTRGLAQAGAPGLVRSVLDQHDASHGTWVALIAQVRRRDSAAATLLDALYVQHGRAAGALERGGHPLLPAVLAEAVLALHARELQACTAAVVAALSDLPATPQQEARQPT